jgi:hypothetical protein
MPVSRASYEALNRKYQRVQAQLEAHDKADRAETRSITRLAAEVDALKRIVAGHIRHLERSTLSEHASPLHAQLADAGIDITIELDRSCRPGGSALPATRTYTAAESRLIAELHRSEKARGALESQLLDVQRVNEAQARQLRAATEAEGSAA